ncbi:MAG: DUF362 domain-containing protein [Acidobacteria bacterium]|nr:MAG: DUF362 domain-containing protein [Acidobacteriota bacterium]
MKRRTFLKSAWLGYASSFVTRLKAQGLKQFSQPKAPPIQTHGLPKFKPSPLGMPGLFPGRVVEVVDPQSITNNHVAQPVVQSMLERGMRELTGKGSVEDAWRLFIQPADVVGIKINPSGAPACYSSPEIVREIIRAVEMVGVPAHNIVVYDRYSFEVQLGSYRAFLPLGVRLVGIENGMFDLSGYDMNVYCQADFFGEWETRSYLAQVVSQEVTKIINVPTLKDHSAAGVTGCLKNLGYGSFNNVARSHHQPITFTDPLIGVMCSVEPLRSKAVLHIMDGMREVWHGGPLTQVQSFIAQTGMLILGTDPVAIDRIELDLIHKKRQAEGALSLWDRNPKNITFDSNEFYHNSQKNLFYRQPGHIAAAGELGLGISDLQKIDRHRIRVGT